MPLYAAFRNRYSYRVDSGSWPVLLQLLFCVDQREHAQSGMKSQSILPESSSTKNTFGLTSVEEGAE